MKTKNKTAIYISCLGILLSVAIVVFQVLTPQPITTGLVILFANITLLLVNLSQYKKKQ
ncbi:hypothetical protein [Fusibacter sp. 3D3]|uniref:hypothetical protein n=1 Tax=Fusibacter sp. 3D3 TaxID=1048380 RepID=UPI0008557D03|nr:hypothetical protein [Fusibacter sp. 3D3]GAU78388.1 hypothetical protein F3D3_3021 [Fusibacter sp. 3D3]